MNKQELPIFFVTGASRSGTTMMSRILGGHDDILAMHELHYFGDLWPIAKLDQVIPSHKLLDLVATLKARLNRGMWREKLSDADIEVGRKFLKELNTNEITGKNLFVLVVQDAVRSAGKVIACEQTPRNIFYASTLLKTFSTCKIVHMVRDPRDVLASQKNRWRQQLLDDSQMPSYEALRVRLNYHPLTVARLWNKANQQALQLQKDPRAFLVRFEDVINEPERYIRKVCEFLEVEFQPGMLQIPKWGSSHEPDQRGVGIRKAATNRWKTVLDSGEIVLCERASKNLMSLFSYQPVSSNSWFSRSLFYHLLHYPLHMLAVLAVNPRRAWIQLAAMHRNT